MVTFLLKMLNLGSIVCCHDEPSLTDVSLYVVPWVIRPCEEALSAGTNIVKRAMPRNHLLE